LALLGRTKDKRQKTKDKSKKLRKPAFQDKLHDEIQQSGNRSEQ
jgi:hypothetical protein